MDQTYLNKTNFKLLLEWDRCITDGPQKEREISFCYFTRICVGETVLHLKTKWHFKCTSSHDLSVALLITQTKYTQDEMLSRFATCEASPLLSHWVAGGAPSASPLLTNGALSASLHPLT